MQYLLSILGFLYLVAGCNAGLETVEKKDAEGNLVERFQRRKTDFAREGLYEQFFPDGSRIEVASYRNDTLDGQRTLYYENGQLQYTENYDMGQFHGPYRAYYPSGQLKLEQQYFNNRLEGESRAWYENGQLKEVVQFEQNQENGPFREYYPNGQLKAEGTYLEGDNEHGELKLYDEDGTLVRVMQCDRGICRTTWEKEPNN